MYVAGNANADLRTSIEESRKIEPDLESRIRVVQMFSSYSGEIVPSQHSVPVAAKVASCWSLQTRQTPEVDLEPGVATFAWTGVRQAAYYEVALFDISGLKNVLVWQGRSKALSCTPDFSLLPNRRYQARINAFDSEAQRIVTSVSITAKSASGAKVSV